MDWRKFFGYWQTAHHCQNHRVVKSVNWTLYIFHQWKYVNGSIYVLFDRLLNSSSCGTPATLMGISFTENAHPFFVSTLIRWMLERWTGHTERQAIHAGRTFGGNSQGVAVWSSLLESENVTSENNQPLLLYALSKWVCNPQDAVGESIGY